VTRAQTQARGPVKERAWRVLLDDGEGGPWRLESGALLDRDAPVEGLGALGKVIGGLIGNPVTYTHRGVLEEKSTGRKFSGIFEVSISSE
jgi:hypothetical protein